MSNHGGGGRGRSWGIPAKDEEAVGRQDRDGEQTLLPSLCRVVASLLESDGGGGEWLVGNQSESVSI